MSEEPILNAVRQALGRSSEVKVGVALSGGMDSVVLAEALVRLEVPFLALHVDHGWRAEESRKDALWVKRWCRERKVPLLQKKLKAGLPRTEAAARDARLDFYQRAGALRGVQEIWLAHHADDLVETFLLQLLRGAGPEGLASMPERRVLGSIVLVRPLLGFRKKELKALAKKWKLEWREDSSNRSDDYLRNRVRRGLLPYLKKISGRDPALTLSRLVRVLADENVYWEQFLPKKGTPTLSCEWLRKETVAAQRRVIRGWLLSRGITGISFADIEQVRGLLLRDKPAKVNLDKGRYCRRRGGILFVE